jgi:hypothetical protein
MTSGSFDNLLPPDVHLTGVLDDDGGRVPLQVPVGP